MKGQGEKETNMKIVTAASFIIVMRKNTKSVVVHFQVLTVTHRQAEPYTH